ncbi:hypothetical protein PPL_02087 [Heterostelium album PN500]|uniref:Methyltransferase type 11 domain-containing protein n=1 Tax=Heterostelium pallidum (strain ATCC 26659 / Pp 5 / PN500) TaxID=670386 RepID=D3B1B6_HETP5|nr:hypothetical protein PPL_02087 [Heterostelium album PN500]EFA85090.1 hypothetical protein PPL_02087 [Heterostelium album PN500]|eukprot:XP_020437199.1 hypothetical protein PPL_02087 [Heterostelium album PN500]
MGKKKGGGKREEYIDDPSVSPASYVFWEDFYEVGEGKAYQRSAAKRNQTRLYKNDLKEKEKEKERDRERDKASQLSNIYQILHIGCGNSLIAEELLLDIEENKLLDLNILNVDVCSNAIERMVQRQLHTTTNKRIKQSLKYQVMDATDTQMPDDHFNGIIDKGTIDALLSTLDVEVGENEMVKKLLVEMYRVLKPGGFLFVVSRNTCAEQYFYMEESIEWNLTTTPLNVNSSKGKGIINQTTVDNSSTIIDFVISNLST